MQYGLIGKTLGHSFSPEIHAMLGAYAYELISMPEDALDGFMREKAFCGINVTLPYKQAVISYCDSLSDIAREIGAVNTVVNRNGKLLGDNTDFYGLTALIRRQGIDPAGNKALVLGGGGTSRTAQAVLRHMGAKEIVVVSRSGPVTYGMLQEHHRDAALIVNTTPVGMYPNNGEAPVDISIFPALCGVVDVVYNPLSSALVLAANKRGISAAGGLYMLVSQAKKSAELFLNTSMPNSRTDEITAALLQKRKNIVLIGMPGCGKTTVGTLLAKKTGRTLIDTDDLIQAAVGEEPASYLSRVGEAAFRKTETEVIQEAGKRTGVVIATGGGAVLREENLAALKQNGVIYWLQRRLEALPVAGRPLSVKQPITALYEARRAYYERFSDDVITNDCPAEETVGRLLEAFYANTDR